MGMAQFAKVVLLPQGDFAAFLRATPEDRREVLERLFDISAFSDVESWLAEERRSAGAELERARLALSADLLRVEDVLADAGFAHGEATAVSLADTPAASVPRRLRGVVEVLDARVSSTMAEFDAASGLERAAAEVLAAARSLADRRRRGARALAQLASLEAAQAQHEDRVRALAEAARAATVGGHLTAHDRAIADRAAAVEAPTARGPASRAARSPRSRTTRSRGSRRGSPPSTRPSGPSRSSARRRPLGPGVGRTSTRVPSGSPAALTRSRRWWRRPIGTGRASPRRSTRSPRRRHGRRSWSCGSPPPATGSRCSTRSMQTRPRPATSGPTGTTSGRQLSTGEPSSSTCGSVASRGWPGSWPEASSTASRARSAEGRRTPVRRTWPTRCWRATFSWPRRGWRLPRASSTPSSGSSPSSRPARRPARSLSAGPTAPPSRQPSRPPPPCWPAREGPSSRGTRRRRALATAVVALSAHRAELGAIAADGASVAGLVAQVDDEESAAAARLEALLGQHEGCPCSSDDPAEHVRLARALVAHTASVSELAAAGSRTDAARADLEAALVTARVRRRAGGDDSRPIRRRDGSAARARGRPRRAGGSGPGGRGGPRGRGGPSRPRSRTCRRSRPTPARPARRSSRRRPPRTTPNAPCGPWSASCRPSTRRVGRSGLPRRASRVCASSPTPRAAPGPTTR